MEYVIDFCGGCGAFVDNNTTEEINNRKFCLNCGNDVTDHNSRCQGVFSEEDTKRFLLTQGVAL